MSTVTELYICEICSKQFKQEKNLIKHLDAKHNIACEIIQKEMFQCQLCDKAYATEKFLDKHMQRHGM